MVSCAQNTSEGKYDHKQTFLGSSTKVPIGKHTSEDPKDRIAYTVEYNENGIIKRIETKSNGEESKTWTLEEDFSQVNWVEITPGLWINQSENPTGENMHSTIDKDKSVRLHYSGYLLSGEPFDNSFMRNQPLEGKLGHYIKGFSIGVDNMSSGEVRMLKISPELGYGENGAGGIPPNATMVYVIYLIR